MPTRVLTTLLLLLALPSVAHATPLTLALFGDSLTCDACNDGSYARLLNDYLDPDATLYEHGVSSDRTVAVLDRFNIWLADSPGEVDSTDAVVFLTGTPDAYQVVGGFHNQNYVEDDTVNNVKTMLSNALGAGIQPFLVAPPTVVKGCGGPDSPLTCSDIQSRLAALQVRYQNLAANLSVPFVDLYTIFLDAPGNLINLYRSDGLHFELSTGDDLTAQSIASAIAAQMAVPEPSTVLLVIPGLMALSIARRRARR